MASKIMLNAAFKAPLLLRPPHRHTALFGTVIKLECRVRGRLALPPILSSRSYSVSTSTSSFPKCSGSTEATKSSGPEQVGITLDAWGKTLFTLGIVGGAVGYMTRELWLPDWYKDYRRHIRESARKSARESAMYDKLKKGPTFGPIEHTVIREPHVAEMRELITPTKRSHFYSVITGEDGNGKMSLLKLAMSGIDEPKGIIYVDIPFWCDSEADVVEAMQEALGWSSDQPIEPTSLPQVFRTFSRLAIKYKQEYDRVPVLIINNANKLAHKHQRLLDQFQNYAMDAAEKGTATVVFMSREGRIPRGMLETRPWPICRQIMEIGDASKEEALQYLKLRQIDDKQAAQIYELVGGRMIHLKFIADEIGRDRTLEALRQTMFRNAIGQLGLAEILPYHRYHKDGAKIVRALLKGPISRETYYGLVGVDTGNKLLEKNVFAFHYNSGEITFQSTAMKRYCEENSGLWEGKRTSLLHIR